jgi:hypothetical protein
MADTIPPSGKPSSSTAAIDPYAMVGQPAKTWEQIVNQVVIYGWPDDLDSASQEWQVLFTQLREISTTVKREVAELKTQGVWSGEAYEAFARHMNAIMTGIDTVVEQAGTQAEIHTTLSNASHILRRAQQDMPIPTSMIGNLYQARQEHSGIADGAFMQAFALPWNVLSAVSETTLGHLTRDLEDQFNIHRTAATNAYNVADNATHTEAQRLPAAPSSGSKIDERTVSPFKNPPSTELSDFGDGGSHTAFPGAGAPPGTGLPADTSYPPGASPGIDSGSVPSQNPGGIDPYSPGSSYPPSAGAGAGRLDAEGLRDGSGLAGAEGWGGSAFGPGSAANDPQGLGRLPAGAGTASSSGITGAAGTSLPGGGSIGRGVTPAIPPGMMGGAPSRGGAGSSAAGKRKIKDALTTGKTRPKSNDDDHKHHYDWKYVDDDIWSTDTDVPPPVLG